MLSTADSDGQPERRRRQQLTGADTWVDEARRYHIGIAGKFGKNVQAAPAKVASLDVRVIAPLHGPALTKNLAQYVDLYDTWSGYRPEVQGIVIAYSSVYGHTKEAVRLLAKQLHDGGTSVTVHDLMRDNMSCAVADAFRFDRLVLATTTYCGAVFPAMQTLIAALVERNLQNRRVALIDNGSWAPTTAKVMRSKMEEMAGISVVEPVVTIRGALNEGSRENLSQLAKALMT